MARREEYVLRGIVEFLAAGEITITPKESSGGVRWAAGANEMTPGRRVHREFGQSEFDEVMRNTDRGLRPRAAMASMTASQSETQTRTSA
jgi:hypothetical protein